MPNSTEGDVLYTPRRGLSRPMDTDSIQTAFNDFVNRDTEPETVEGNYVVWEPRGNHTIIYPIGTGVDTATYSMNLWGWKRLADEGGTTTDLWVKEFIGLFACTLSASVGVAGSIVDASDRFADTVVPSNTLDKCFIRASSPGGDENASILLDTLGFQRVLAEWDLDAGVGTSATGGNLLKTDF